MANDLKTYYVMLDATTTYARIRARDMDHARKIANANGCEGMEILADGGN